MKTSKALRWCGLFLVVYSQAFMDEPLDRAACSIIGAIYLAAGLIIWSVKR